MEDGPGVSDERDNGHRVLPAEPGTHRTGPRHWEQEQRWSSSLFWDLKDEKHLRRGEGEDNGSDLAAEDTEAHRAEVTYTGTRDS